MKQITEDYVSFEVAKLLKEKGFIELTNAYYDKNEQHYITPNPYIPKGYLTLNSFILCPTHQMVLKWLRLCYDIIIDVSPNLTLNDVCKGGFMAEIYQYGHVVPYGEFGCNIGDEYTYEEVVESSLLYVLKNLI